MTDETPMDDHALAAWLADAGRRPAAAGARQGLVGRELKDAGDAAAHELLMDLLAEHRPGDAVLSEEGKDDKARLDADRVWIVDPLDGTREFSEPPRDDWAVHVALWERNGQERRADRRRGGPAGDRRDVRHRRAARRTPAHRGAVPDRGLPQPPARVHARSWPRSSTPRWCRWARPA